MRSAIEITQSILLTACWHGIPCGPDPCICEPIAKAIELAQREAIEAAAKVADEVMEARAKGNPFVEPGDAIRRALLPAPAREGETT